MRFNQLEQLKVIGGFGALLCTQNTHSARFVYVAHNNERHCNAPRQIISLDTTPVLRLYVDFGGAA